VAHLLQLLAIFINLRGTTPYTHGKDMCRHVYIVVEYPAQSLLLSVLDGIVYDGSSRLARLVCRYVLQIIFSFVI
jgi:hypothetical protein